VTTRVISNVEELEALGHEWDELARRASATPFMLSGYLAEVWRRTEARVYCLLADRGDRLVGALPLQVRRLPWAREAALLAGSHRCDLLCHPGEPRDTARALVEGARELPLDWLPVYGVTPGAVLARSLPQRALRPQQERIFHLDMPDGWEAAYQQGATSKRRADDRRRLRGLHKEGDVSFEVATEPEHVQRALTDAFEIYGRRWQHQAGESGGFGSDSESWRAVAGRLAAAGNVQIVLLRIDGTPLAFTYNFIFNDTLWGHRLAHAPGYDRYSPGRLTMLHTFAVASEAGVRRVDFGLGGDAYKAQLATGSDPVLWGTAIASGPRGVLAARLNEARFAARQRAKQSDAVLRARQRVFALRKRLPARA
jgi:CelD/BcsL family acetyltransferase involved in cellulose biosynthesis